MYPLIEELFDPSSKSENTWQKHWAALKKAIEFVTAHFKEIIPLGSDFLVETSGPIEYSLWEEFLEVLGQEMGSQPWVITQGPNLYLVTLVP